MKKTQKKNNKGFSLVELIVVVLIMAIIAVALAPQVMKWVGNARIANDRQTIDSVLGACETALTDKKAYTAVTGASTFEITINTSGVSWGSAPSDFQTAVNKVLDTTKIKLKTDSASATIEVTNKGHVSVKTRSDNLSSDELDS